MSQNENGELLVSARDLHEYFESKERFSKWFSRIIDYGFDENVDYVGCKVFNTLARQELQDYACTIDMAKEIAMIQRNEKGKQARRYFIECEKQLKAQVPQLTRKQQLQLQILNGNEEESASALKEYEIMISTPLLETIEEQQETIDRQDAKIDELDLQVNTLLDISDLPEDEIRSRIFEFMRPRYESYGALYTEFDLRYHINSKARFDNYRSSFLERWERGEVKKKDMIKSQLAFICDELDMSEELYLVMADVFSSDFIHFLKAKLDNFDK